MSIKRIAYLIIILAVASILLYECKEGSSAADWKNAAPNAAQYEGMKKCQQCHAEIFETYTKSEMGMSWRSVDSVLADSNFSVRNAYVYDAKSNLHYQVFRLADSLMVKEFRVLQGDTVHIRLEKIHAIVGSGQHAYNGIINSNGYLYQIPVAYYSQKKKWDLSPGYEDSNSRFERPIQAECITCHNGYPEQVAGSLNKYKSIQHGIDCERCHGPGSLHVSAIESGHYVNTEKETDYNIVNPKRLPVAEQNSVCQRCHLQGAPVLEEGKSFYSFMPSQLLSKNWYVFLPSFAQKNNNMIMASHVERMQMSKCFTASNAMSCVNCHNPHVSIRATPVSVYNKACQQCHKATNTCTQSMAKRKSNGDNCTACHMKNNGSIDIPHVAIFDHYIRRDINAPEPMQSNAFMGIACHNSNTTSNVVRARGFLELYERFLPKVLLLDSAISYLQDEEQAKLYNNKDVIRAYFLRSDFNKVLQYAQPLKPTQIKDAWNAYRIAEAYEQVGNAANNDNQKNIALEYIEQACKLMPLNLAFQNKRADAYYNRGNLQKAKEIYNYILQEEPHNYNANSSLGYMALQQPDFATAQKYLSTAVQQNPNNAQSLINLSVVYYNLGQKNKIKPLLMEAQYLAPQNEQVKAMLKDLGF